MAFPNIPQPVQQIIGGPSEVTILGQVQGRLKDKLNEIKKVKEDYRNNKITKEEFLGKVAELRALISIGTKTLETTNKIVKVVTKSVSTFKSVVRVVEPALSSLPPFTPPGIINILLKVINIAKEFASLLEGKLGGIKGFLRGSTTNSFPTDEEIEREGEPIPDGFRSSPEGEGDQPRGPNNTTGTLIL